MNEPSAPSPWSATVELCGFYEVSPALLLAEIEEAVGGRPEVIVDLSRLEGWYREPSTDG